MENIKVTVKDGILTMVVDLKHRGELSGSGKSTIVATTSGNIPIPGYEEVKMGVNIYVPVKK